MSNTTMTTTEAAVLSLRERKKWATRAALRRSAVALVSSRGLAAVKVEDIAAAADVSPRTFFNYFPCKEDAICGWDPILLAEMADRLRGRPVGEAAPAALQAALLEVMAPFDADHRDLLERLCVIRSDPNLTSHHVARWAEAERRLVAVLAERRDAGTTDDRYAQLVVAATLSASRVAMQSWCTKEGNVPLAEEMACCFDVLLHGFSEPGRATS
ncbi:MAG: TetR family transcriptional regulator [Acidimicrobiales bacterium]